MDHSDTETRVPSGTGDLLHQAIHVSDWTFDSHRKTSGIGTASYETHPMARPGALGETHSASASRSMFT